MSNARGIDVSKYQGEIVWSQVARSGYDFAIIRATKGTSEVDPWFGRHWTGAKAAGLIRGAYHFGLASQDPRAQSRKFASTVGPLGHDDLQLVLDFEVSDGQTPARCRAWGGAFVAEALRLSGHRPLIYTSPAFWDSMIGNETFGCQLWVAHWYVTVPRLPVAWQRYAFWQHSSTGHVAGVSGPVDLDTFAGDRAALAGFARAKGSERVTLAQRLASAGFGARSVEQVIARLRAWDGVIRAPRPGDSALFRRLRSAGFGVESARKIVHALRRR